MYSTIPRSIPEEKESLFESFTAFQMKKETTTVAPSPSPLSANFVKNPPNYGISARIGAIKFKTRFRIRFATAQQVNVVMMPPIQRSGFLK